MQLHVSFAQCHKCVCVNAKHMQVLDAGYNQAEQERITREFCRSTLYENSVDPHASLDFFMSVLMQLK